MQYQPRAFLVESLDQGGVGQGVQPVKNGVDGFKSIQLCPPVPVRRPISHRLKSDGRTVFQPAPRIPHRKLRRWDSRLPAAVFSSNSAAPDASMTINAVPFPRAISPPAEDPTRFPAAPGLLPASRACSAAPAPVQSRATRNATWKPLPWPHAPSAGGEAFPAHPGFESSCSCEQYENKKNRCKAKSSRIQPAHPRDACDRAATSENHSRKSLNCQKIAPKRALHRLKIVLSICTGCCSRATYECRMIFRNPGWL